MDIGPLTILTIGLAVALLIAPLVIMHVLDREQDRTEAWRKLAARHHLQFNPGRRVVQKTTVSGILRGREFLLDQVAGKKNQAAVHMELLLGGSLPEGLELHPVDGSVAKLAAITGIPVEAMVRGGDQVAIDDRLRATAADPEDLPAYLTPRRTKAALQLAEIGGSLEDHKLRVPVTKTMTDLEELDRTLRTLRRLAPLLETAQQAAGESC